MIEKVVFTNFKALRYADVRLSKLTLIVGPNSSGKTSILEGLHCLSQVGAEIPDTVFAGPQHPNRLRTSGVDDTMKLSLVGNWNGVPG